MSCLLEFTAVLSLIGTKDIVWFVSISYISSKASICCFDTQNYFIEACVYILFIINILIKLYLNLRIGSL